MSASGTTSRLAARVLRYTANIHGLHGTLFLAPVLSQCAIVRQMASSTGLQQPQWQAPAAGGPPRSTGSPEKAGGHAQPRSGRRKHQHTRVPLNAEAAAAVLSSKDSSSWWRPPATPSTTGAATTAATMFSSSHSIIGRQQQGGGSTSVSSSSGVAAAQQQGALHWSASFEPFQELGDPLSLAILGATTHQQLQQLVVNPPTAWQPQQVVLALMRLTQLACGTPTAPLHHLSADAQERLSSSSSSAAGMPGGLHLQPQQGRGQQSPSDRQALLNLPAVQEQAQTLAALLLGNMQQLAGKPSSSSSSSSSSGQGRSSGVSPWVELSPYQLTALMDSAAQLRLRQPALWQGCLQALLAAGDSASSNSLVTALRVLAAGSRAEAGAGGRAPYVQHASQPLVPKQQAQALTAACCNHAAVLSPSSIRCVLQSANTLCVDLTPQQLEQLSAAFRVKLAGASHATVTWFLQGLARAGHPVQRGFVEELVQALLLRLEANPSTALAAAALYGVAKLGTRVSPGLLQQLAAQLLPQGQGQQLPSPTTISRGLWALGRLYKNGLLPPECVPQGVVQALLQQLLRHPRLASQSCANSLWAAAVLQQPVQSGTLQAMVVAFDHVLVRSKTQEVANMVWAAAMVYSLCLPPAEGCAAAAPGQDAEEAPLWALEEAPQQQQQQQQGSRLPPRQELRQLPEWPRHQQEVPAGTPGQEVVLPVLQGVLPGWLGFLAAHAGRAAAQELSISLWAAYYLQRAPLAADKIGPMLDGLAVRVAAGQYSTVDIANALWASAQYRWYPERLLSSWKAGRRFERDITTADARELSVVANSLARLGLNDAEVLGAMVKRAHDLIDRHGGCHARPLRQLASQVAWAAAVLDQQQLAEQVRPLAAACFAVRSSRHVVLPPQELVQWRQVHTWLMDMDQVGLQAVLSPQQMAVCAAAWRQQAQHIQDSATSAMQRDVFRVVQKLAQLILPGLTIQGMEQLDAQDGFVIIDIVADYAGRRLAIEVDGPRHWLRPDQRASGPSLARNRSLATRGYSVVVVNGADWDQLAGVRDKLRYLLRALCTAVGEEPPSEAWDSCGRWRHLRGWK